MPSSSEFSDGFRVPGKDPDPDAQVEKRVKVGWALVGIFFSAGLLSFILRRLGLSIIPDKPSTLDYVRVIAFAVACINIGIWMWFPLEDLGVLRKWARTKRKLFPRYTSESWAIILATVLLLGSILGALHSAAWFGLAGAGVYLWNTIGFAYVRKHVRIALDESRAVFREQPEPVCTHLFASLQIIERHWTCDKKTFLGGWQQRRHFALFLSFSVVTCLGFIGESQNSTQLNLIAYLLGILTIIAAEVSIGFQRAIRDKQLTIIEQKLQD